jgi:hypothetical protein
MPRPQYILCCQSISVDGLTNTISHFHVIEGLQVLSEVIKAAPGLLFRQSGFWGVAAWTRSEGDDPKCEYEFDICSTPGGGELQSQLNGTMKFTQAAHRFQVQFVLQAPWAQSGHFSFVSRLRAVGTENWLEQKYTFPVEVIQQPTDKD